MIRNIFQDIVFGFRMLKQNWGISLVAVLVIAIGIGLVTTVFSIVNGFIIRGLPYDESNRIYHLKWAKVEGLASNIWNDFWINTFDLADFREQQTTFEALSGYNKDTVNIKGDDYARRYIGCSISANFLEMLRFKPLLGRGFYEDEELRGADPVVIIGYDIWKKNFYGDTNIIGRSMLYNGAPRTVVGVMPKDFNFPLQSELWIPFRHEFPLKTRKASKKLTVFGRLKDGVTIDEALTEFNGIARRLEAEYPESNKGYNTLEIKPYVREYVGEWLFNTLVTMLVAVFLVLLIACSNVANLLLARSTLRNKEMAIRNAIGAPRKRIITQMLTESLIISAFGALGGIFIAGFSLDVLWNYLQAFINTTHFPSWVNFKMDGVVLFFVIGLVLLSGVISGIVPALHSSNTDLNQLLKDNTRTSSSQRIGRFSKFLVIVQVAMSSVLLIGAGLMIKMVIKRSTHDFPYNPTSIFQARTALFDAEFPKESEKINFLNSLIGNLKIIPGIEAVGYTTTHSEPFAFWRLILIDGESYVSDDEYPDVCFAGISDDYFDVFGVSILEGRPFNDTDIVDSQQVAIVNTIFAERFWPGQSAIGKRFKAYGVIEKPWLTIVGVASDLQMEGFNTVYADGSGFYVPMSQKTSNPRNITTRHITVLLRGKGSDPMNWLTTVRQEVQKLNPNQPLYDIKTIQDAIDDELRGDKFFTGLFIAFGGAAFLLAALGVYGVMSFSVSQRMQEMGIRKALGAGPRTIIAMIMKQSSLQVGMGLLFGSLLAVALSRVLYTSFKDIAPNDYTLYLTVIGVIVSVGIFSVWLPARVAARVDPMETLRNE